MPLPTQEILDWIQQCTGQYELGAPGSIFQPVTHTIFPLGFEVKNLSSGMKGWKGALVLLAAFGASEPSYIPLVTHYASDTAMPDVVDVVAAIESRKNGEVNAIITPFEACC